MSVRASLVPVLVALLSLSVPLHSSAAEGCDAINGKWVGSENLVGQRDAIVASYTITAKGSEIVVATDKASAAGTCEAASDAYVLKLNWGEITSEMTFRVVGEDVAMFFWQNSAGDGGRGSLTRESANDQPATQ